MNDQNLKTSKQISMSDLLVNMDEKLNCLFESISELEEGLHSLEAMMICVYPRHSGDKDE